jgi:hypothetical protein
MMLVEYGGNMQTLIGRGVVDLTSISYNYNASSITGSTYDIGNGTGRASGTYFTYDSGDDTKNLATGDGRTSVCYRGMEDPWGSISEFVDGINIHDYQVYIASGYEWEDYSDSAKYAPCGFQPVSGWISSFGYDETYDWLFICAEGGSSSDGIIGDWQSVLNSSTTSEGATLDGCWRSGSNTGPFSLECCAQSSKSATMGARITYVPQYNRS